MPDVQELSDEPESVVSTAEDDHQVELLLAGFRACAKEAIRFLLEEEGLAPDHSLPLGLQEHLDRQQTHLAGMLQSDSGLDSDDIFYSSSADDTSFASSEISDLGYTTDASKLHESSMLSNASMVCAESSGNSGCDVGEQLRDSNG